MADEPCATAATEKAAYRAVLVAVIGAGALVVLALLVGVCWAIDRVLGGWFLLADIVIAAPLALWWQIRAMRANGFPLPWEERP